MYNIILLWGVSHGQDSDPLSYYIRRAPLFSRRTCINQFLYICGYDYESNVLPCTLRLVGHIKETRALHVLAFKYYRYVVLSILYITGSTVRRSARISGTCACSFWYVLSKILYYIKLADAIRYNTSKRDTHWSHARDSLSGPDHVHAHSNLIQIITNCQFLIFIVINIYAHFKRKWILARPLCLAVPHRPLIQLLQQLNSRWSTYAVVCVRSKAAAL